VSTEVSKLLALILEPNTTYRDVMRLYYEESSATVDSFSYTFWCRAINRAHTKLYGEKWYDKKSHERAHANHLGAIIKQSTESRNLAARLARPVGLSMALDGDALDLFVALVARDHGSPDDITRATERIDGLRALLSNSPRADTAFAAFIADWRHVAIVELARRGDFSPDPAWIGARLLPSVDPADVETCLERLLHWGLLARADDGRLTPTGATLSTGWDAQLALQHHYAQMGQLAVEAIARATPAEREIQGTTVLLSDDDVRVIAARVRQLVSEVLGRDDVNTGRKDVRVYHLGVSLFPVSGE